MTYTIPGTPISKPRMTSQGKNKPGLKKYWNYAYKIKTICTKLPVDPKMVTVYAYFPFPKSYSKKKRKELASKAHRVKPDCDNVLKGVMDALFKNDSGIYHAMIKKYWDDGEGPRTEIAIG